MVFIIFVGFIYIHYYYYKYLFKFLICSYLFLYYIFYLRIIYIINVRLFQRNNYIARMSNWKIIDKMLYSVFSFVQIAR